MVCRDPGLIIIRMIVENETTIRLGFFLGIFLLVGGWELLAPRRGLTDAKLRRWADNLGLVAINTLMLRLAFPLLAVGLAAMAQESGWGLFNILQLPAELTLILSLLILDFIIYLQHVMFHMLPTLWRLHRMHHSDLDLDVTSGARFHPLEIILSMLIKMGAVLMLGPSPQAVILFEVILNLSSMFNHGNIYLPVGLDRILRLLVVTPDMHRVHHSVIVRETNSNYGFCFPWWDRLCGTYRAQPEAGHTGMTIGLKEFRRPEHLGRLLMQPFRNPYV